MFFSFMLTVSLNWLSLLSPTDSHFQEVWLHQVQHLWLWWHDGWEASDSRWLWGEVHPQQRPPLSLEGPARQLEPLKALCDQTSNKSGFDYKNDHGGGFFISVGFFLHWVNVDLMSSNFYTFLFADLKNDLKTVIRSVSWSVAPLLFLSKYCWL